MCGRFTQRFSWQQVHDYMNLLGEPVELTPRYNVAPGQQVAAVRVALSLRMGMGELRAWRRECNENRRHWTLDDRSPLGFMA